MKFNRTKNATRNIISGFALKIYQIITPFIIRTIMIYFLGMEYVGLNTLFSSILQVLNLAELGVGSAMVYSMYKPIAVDDSITICALMRLYKIYYRIIGLIVLISGMVIMPFVPRLISGTVPNGMNVYVLYALNLSTTVISYWLFAYKNSLLTAHQRTDVINKITILVSTIQYIFQTVILLALKNYYAFLIVSLFSQLLMNVVSAIVATKMFPDYKAKGCLDKSTVKSINQRVKDLFTSKLGSIIVNSADTIVISAFLGLSVLAVYNNYYFVLNAVLGVIVTIFSACTAGIGNSLIVENVDKNYQDVKKLTLLTGWVGGACSCCLLCLYQPFMKMWIGEDHLLEMKMVICLSIYFYVIVLNQMLCLYKDASGVWHKDRFRPLITAAANLSLNLLTVKRLGLYGIVLSTVISMIFIGMPWLIRNLFTEVFKRNCLEFVLLIAYCAFITAMSCVITFMICHSIKDKGITTFLIKCMICLVIPNIIHLVAFSKNAEFKSSLQLVNKTLGNIINHIPILNKYM